LNKETLFKGIDAQFVPVDLTLPEDAYQPLNYGLEAFWQKSGSSSAHGIAMMLHDMKEIRKELHDV